MCWFGWQLIHPLSPEIEILAEQVTLFIGNLTEEWQDEERLKNDLSKHGRIERAFIAYNALGQSKVSLMSSE